MDSTGAAPLVESFGTLNLPVGGKHGYKGVRGESMDEAVDTLLEELAASE